MKMKSKHERILNPATWPSSRVMQTMMRNFVCVVLLGLLVSTTTSAKAAASSIGGKRGLNTMTVNLYVGGDSGRVLLLDPANPAYLSNLVFTVTGIYYEIVASQPAVRLGGVADQIAERLPDLVAVQEASLLRVQSPGDLVTGGHT